MWVRFGGRRAGSARGFCPPIKPKYHIRSRRIHSAGVLFLSLSPSLDLGLRCASALRADGDHHHLCTEGMRTVIRKRIDFFPANSPGQDKAYMKKKSMIMMMVIMMRRLPPPCPALVPPETDQRCDQSLIHSSARPAGAPRGWDGYCQGAQGKMGAWKGAQRGVLPKSPPRIPAMMMMVMIMMKNPRGDAMMVGH